MASKFGYGERRLGEITDRLKGTRLCRAGRGVDGSGVTCSRIRKGVFLSISYLTATQCLVGDPQACCNDGSRSSQLSLGFVGVWIWRCKYFYDTAALVTVGRAFIGPGASLIGARLTAFAPTARLTAFAFHHVTRPARTSGDTCTCDGSKEC